MNGYLMASLRCDWHDLTWFGLTDPSHVLKYRVGFINTVRDLNISIGIFVRGFYWDLWRIVFNVIILPILTCSTW